MQPPDTTRSRRIHLAMFAALVLACLICYGRQFGNGFTNWDDNWLITENRWIRGFDADKTAAILDPTVPLTVREELGNEYLPVRDFSYSLNFAMGGYDPTAYQLTNWLLHLLNVVLVWLLARRLLAGRWPPFLCALLFALMPVHVEVVAWLSARKDLLATCFTLVSALGYLRYRERIVTPGRPTVIPAKAGIQTPTQGQANWVPASAGMTWYIISVLAFLLAMLSKVPAIALPGALIVFEIFLRPQLTPISLKRLALLLAPYAAIAATTFIIGYRFASNGLIREPFGGDRLTSTLTSIASLWRYVEAMVIGWPTQAAVDYPVQHGIGNAPVLGALTIIFLLVALARCWQATRIAPTKAPHWLAPFAIGMGWLVLMFVPVSNLIFVTGTAYADRYAYLPSIGWCIAIVAFGIAFIPMIQQRRRLTKQFLIATLCGVFLWYGWNTWDQTGNWRNSRALWSSVLDADPENHVALFNLGRSYQEDALYATGEVRRLRLTKARDLYLQASSTPTRTYRYDRARALLALSLTELQLDAPEQAMHWAEQAKTALDIPWRTEHDRNSLLASIANLRGQAYSALKKTSEAEAAFREGVQRAYEGRDDAGFAQALTHIDDYDDKRGYQDVPSLEMRADITLKHAEAVEGDAAEPPEPARKLYDQAAMLYARAAEQLLLSAPLTNPHRFNLLIKQAEAVQRAPGNDDKALAILHDASAVPLEQPRAGPGTIRAKILLRNGRVQEAEQELKDELRIDTEYGPAREELAAIGIGVADAKLVRLRDKWREEYCKARLARTGETVDAPPDDTALFYELADNKDFGAELGVVRAYVERAMELTGRNTETARAGAGFLTALGHAISMRGDRKSAEELLRESYNKDTELELTSTLLGTIYFSWLEDIGPRAHAAARDGNVELARELYQDMWDLIGRVVLLSERAAKILADRIVRKANAEKVRIDKTIPDHTSEAYLQHTEILIEYYKMALLLDDEQVEALSQLKTFYQETGRYEDAVETYRQLERAVADNPIFRRDVLRSTGELLYVWARHTIGEYRKLLAGGDEAGAQDARREAIDILLEAVDIYEQALALQRVDPSRQFLEGFGAIYQNLATLDLGKAVEWLEKAKAVYNLKPGAFDVELAFVHRKLSFFLQDPDAQLRELEAAKNLETDAEARESLLARIERVELRKAIQEVDKLLDSGDTKQAMERVRAIRSDDPEWQHLAARAHDAAGEKREAATLYAGLTTNVDAQIRAGELYHSLGLPADLGLAYISLRRAQSSLDQSIAETAARGGDTGAMHTKLEHVNKLTGEIEQRAVSMTTQAREALARLRLLEAEQLAQDSLTIASINPHTHEVLALIAREWARANLLAAEREQNDGQSERAARSRDVALGHFIGAASHFRQAADAVGIPSLQIKFLGEELNCLLDGVLPLTKDMKWYAGNAKASLAQFESAVEKSGKRDQYTQAINDYAKKLKAFLPDTPE
ncbi:MAG: hypothetical protein L6Q71_03980 [Planctomycetes bacterium]|nr:hypothetical protein [Planctomycetota bacterium]